MTGVVAGSRLYGSRAREPLTPAAAVVPPSVPGSLPVAVVPSESAKLPLPSGSETGSAETSAGIPLGVKPCARPAPRATPTGTSTGVSMPALVSCSTSTSVARPHVLPVIASRLDRPTVHAGYCPTIATVSDATSKTTRAHTTIVKGACATRDQRLGLLGGVLPRPVKWNQAATSRATTDSPSRIVVNPNLYCGNSFDHGTPKLETYHQPF